MVLETGEGFVGVCKGEEPRVITGGVINCTRKSGR